MLIMSGVAIPTMLTQTSPSAMATARYRSCASARTAQVRISAAVAKPPMRRAAVMVAGSARPNPSRMPAPAAVPSPTTMTGLRGARDRFAWMPAATTPAANAT